MNNSDLIKSQKREIQRLKNEIESLQTGFKTNSKIDVNKFLFQLTILEYLELMDLLKQPEAKVTDTTDKKHEYGMGGIARIFNCSLTTANKIKQSGKIDKAITQLGRIIVVDIEMALELNRSTDV